MTKNFRRSALQTGIAALFSTAFMAQAADIPQVKVTVNDKQCEPMTITVNAGKTQFIIQNHSQKALEWEILKGVMVVEERENIAPGFSQKMTVNLQPGEYDMTCGLLTNPKGKLIVKGSATADAAQSDALLSLSGAITEYKAYVTAETAQLVAGTKAFTDAIKADVDNISLADLDKCVGCAFEGRIYWTLPVGSSENNQIWTLDLERGRGWMLPRIASVSWLTVYEDNNGMTHFLALSDNGLYEFTYSSLTNDFGTAFGTYVRSGIIKFSEDGMEWASVIDVTFVLLRPRGHINLTVSGLTEDNETSQSIGTDTFNATTAIAGWGEGGFSEPTLGWSESIDVPNSTGITRKSKTIEIDEELQWMYWELSTDETGVDYALSDVIIRYVPIGTKDLTE